MWKLVCGEELVAFLNVLKGRKELCEGVLRDSSFKGFPVFCTGRGGLVFPAQLFREFTIFMEEIITLAAIENNGSHSFHQGVPGVAPLGQSSNEFF